MSNKGIIVIGGAFNPVHTQHLSILSLTKHELETKYHYNIIGAYLAVAPDGYVKNKMLKASPPQRAMSIFHRLSMARLAMQSVEWIKNSPFLEKIMDRHYGGAPDLGRRAVSLIEADLKERISVFIVVGADRAISKEGKYRWRNHPSEFITVCVGREDEDNNDDDEGEINNNSSEGESSASTQSKTEDHTSLTEKFLLDVKEHKVPHPNKWVIIEECVDPVSSTQVRKMLEEYHVAEDKPKEIREKEQEAIAHKLESDNLLHKEVMDYIQHHKLALYQKL
eukprot:TRINITY_DN6582_c1_g1_i1.p1 TRINITY_DN6582_c1_g1~~TRINITY_DN6582_c1_g1_i1.p1  ORF type:complete len:280 (+),score=54.94 TRINITY_DN6582_c1_g1_i1:209-1048(+)